MAGLVIGGSATAALHSPAATPMSTLKSDFLHELKARGYIHQVTDEAGLDKLLKAERVTGYIGFDARRRACMSAISSRS